MNLFRYFGVWIILYIFYAGILTPLVMGNIAYSLFTLPPDILAIPAVGGDLTLQISIFSLLLAASAAIPALWMLTSSTRSFTIAIYSMYARNILIGVAWIFFRAKEVESLFFYILPLWFCIFDAIWLWYFYNSARVKHIFRYNERIFGRG